MVMCTKPYVMTGYIRGLLLIMGVIAFVRGIDYSTGSASDMGRWVDDGLNMPDVWGAACLMCGVLLLAAAGTGHVRLAINACLIAFAVSFMLAFQVWDVRMWVIPWPPEDVRVPTDHLGRSAIFLLTGVTLWFRDSKHNRAKIIVEEKQSKLADEGAEG